MLSINISLEGSLVLIFSRSSPSSRPQASPLLLGIRLDGSLFENHPRRRRRRRRTRRGSSGPKSVSGSSQGISLPLKNLTPEPEPEAKQNKGFSRDSFIILPSLVLVCPVLSIIQMSGS